MSYGIFASFYDRLMQDFRYDIYAGHLRDIIVKHCPDASIVADIACGTGSIAKLLSEYGYEVIGVDKSEEMLSVAREKTQGDVLFVHQDICELDMFGTYDAAVCTMDSLNHIENENLLEKAFEKISLFMNKNGVFIFDMNTLYKHEKVLAENTFVFDYDDLYCVWQNYFNKDDASVDIELDFFFAQNDMYERYSEDFSEYYYSYDTVRRILGKTGFEIIDALDARTFENAKTDSERVLYIVRKK